MDYEGAILARQDMVEIMEDDCCMYDDRDYAKEYYTMLGNDLIKWLTDVAEEEAKSPSPSTTYIFNLHEDYYRKIRWAIVAGYDDEGILCAKIGYQPQNSIMKEYDIDWVMPWFEDTGEVWDTECSFNKDMGCRDIIHITSHLVTSFQYMQECLERGELNV